jgi:hypothetical protein
MSDAVVSPERCECGQQPLVAERSVPISGFSVDLRQAGDVQRYRFFFALVGKVEVPVHVVFSPSLHRAEVKAADLKALVIPGVDSPCDAQKHWIAWWQAVRVRQRVNPPRRTGNHPTPPRAST